MKVILLPLLFAFCAARAGAAGTAAGRSAAAGEAAYRVESPKLVEIEGFADDNGGIPCGKRSYSGTWHYKFYSAPGQAWRLVNACGDFVPNSAGHIPSRPAAAPREPLAADLADSAAVVSALKKEGLFTAPSTALDRDLYMRAAWLPEEGGRPAGCYWEVSREGKKVYMDCAAKKVFRPSAAVKAEAPEKKQGAYEAAGGKPPAGSRAKDGAARYYKVLTAAAEGRYKGAVLRAVEALTERNGSAKCVGPDDGWVYVFTVPNFGSNVVLGGCKNKTAFMSTDFSGMHGKIGSLQPLPGDFKDSGDAVDVLPKACPASRPTLIMRLRNYKAAAAPITGHGFVWEVDCVGKTHYVDAHTGVYLGEGKD